MALRIHVVSVGFFTVGADGNVLKKSNTSTATINQLANSSSDHRIIPDISIPSSAGYPTIKAYLEAEAALGYVLQHMTQSMIVTYSQADLNV